MNDYSKALANAVRRARGKMGLTQEKLASLANTDTMNIIKMENINRAANPKLSTLYPVIRALNIDPMEVFYPEVSIENPRIRLLQQIVSDCTDEEADALIPIIRELIIFMRGNEKLYISE